MLELLDAKKVKIAVAGMNGGQSIQDLARVSGDPRRMGVHAVSGVERNSHAPNLTAANRGWQPSDRELLVNLAALANGGLPS